MNIFNQQIETKKDNDLYDSNFKLTQDLFKKQNVIQKMEQQIQRLKESKADEGTLIVDKFILEPSSDLLAMLNKETTEIKAIEENQQLREKVEKLMLE